MVIARDIRDIAHSLKESLEKCRTELTELPGTAEKKDREAQQALQQAEQKGTEAQTKLNQLEQARRQQQQDELQLITRRQDLEGLTQQAEQQARERAETSLEQMGTVLQEKLSPAFEKLEDLSVQVGEVQQFIETADQTNDGLAEAQREVASTTTLIFQQFESVVSRLDALIEDTTRIKEEEHDRMVDELRTEMANAARSEEFGQALDDIRNVPQQVELVKTILTTEIQSLDTRQSNAWRFTNQDGTGQKT
ncbi:hypothetical protein QBC32DRAFT_389623 [Pseudoneurospora amorphoporcata]|uniref:Uncharacterized protein n=1 Tax=Pseudoneurospora amorphoporcata TaxID=241081 RepID=A0AAN6SFT2_9PEZI|nr:hypothetical protein QBC32DRAFT_389623 [Pseudoneurospora amorphoporcata]